MGSKHRLSLGLKDSEAVVRKVSATITCDDLSRLQYMSAGVEIACALLPPVGYQRTKPFFLDEANASDAAQKIIFEIFANCTAPARQIPLFRFTDSKIIGQGAVILPDGRLIADTAIEFLNHNLKPDGFDDCDGKLCIPDNANDTTLSGTSLLVKRPWYRNYGHWLVDLAPLIPLVHQAGLKVDNIIYGDVQSGDMKEIMISIAKRYFPFAKLIFQRDDELITAEQLLYAQTIHVPPLYKHPFGPRLTQFVLEDMGTLKNEGPERIYISRQKLANRRILNHDELVPVLEKFGFTTVYPERMSVFDQISVFKTAKIILGIKGAGLTNCLFSKRGSHVLVLSPPEFTDAFFWDLLSPMGVKYSEIYCAITSECHGSVSGVDISIDANKINDALKKIVFDINNS